MTSSCPGWRWKSWHLPGRNVASIATMPARPSRGPLTWANTPQSCCVAGRASSPGLNAPAILVPFHGIDLNRRMFSVIATSVGSRSIDEAPKKPTTPSVRART